MENSITFQNNNMQKGNQFSQSLDNNSKPFKITKSSASSDYDSDNSWEVAAQDPHKKMKRETDSADFSKLNNSSEIWRIDHGLLPKCFPGVRDFDQQVQKNPVFQNEPTKNQESLNFDTSNLGLLMKKYEDLKSEFMAKYMKKKGKYLPISLENQQLAKDLDWPYGEGRSDTDEGERRFVETRSQSEHSPRSMEIESNEGKDLAGVSIVLPHDNFEEPKPSFNQRCPFIIIRDHHRSEGLKERPRRKQSIIETEPFEMDKPYTIDLHVNPAAVPEKIEKTPVGPKYQADIAPMTLNKSQPPSHHALKLVWRPDSVTEEQWNDYLNRASEIIGEKITKEEAAARHLKKFGNNFEKAIDEIKKNKMVYKGHFRVCQTYLRNRSLNFPPKKLFSL